MQEEEFLENPIIKREPCECRNCGRPITIFTKDINEIKVNSMGIPIDYDTILYSAIGYCFHCNTFYKTIGKRGMAFDLRILDPEVDIIKGGIDNVRAINTTIKND